MLCCAVGDDSDDEGKGKGKEVEVEGDGLQDVDNSEAEIAKLLGFGGFSSTKVRISSMQWVEVMRSGHVFYS